MIQICHNDMSFFILHKMTKRWLKNMTIISSPFPRYYHIIVTVAAKLLHSSSHFHSNYCGITVFHNTVSFCISVWFLLTETKISINGKIMNPLTETEMETETETEISAKMKMKRNNSKQKRNWNEKMQNGMKPFHFRFGARTEHVNNACIRCPVPPTASSGPNGPTTHRVPNGLRVRRLDGSPE